MLRLAACVAGIYTCFLTWGYFQEKVSTTPYGQDAVKFKFFIVLNMVQALTASLVAFVYLKVQGMSVTMPPKALLGRYFQVALLNAMASPFSYAALKHIDYPTMILTKSCKLVPVMFMNVLLYRRRFPLYKYVCVALITIGVSGFMLLAPFDEHKKKGAVQSSMYGMLLVLINLTLDGITNSTQDQIFHKYKVTGQQMMCFMSLFMSLFMALWLLNPMNPELGNALAFCQTHPSVLKDIAMFSICGALGQCFIFYTLQHYGSLSLVTVTVTRKLFTILLSVVAYGHVLGFGQWMMVSVVFSGIGLEAYMKRKEKLEKMESQHLPKHSPKPSHVSFDKIQMMKKDKMEDSTNDYVGMAATHAHLQQHLYSSQASGDHYQTVGSADLIAQQELHREQQDTVGQMPFSLRAGINATSNINTTTTTSTTSSSYTTTGKQTRQRQSFVAAKH